MKCISRIFCICLVLSLCGCGSLNYGFSYDADSEISSFRLIAEKDGNKSTTFAQKLCVVISDVIEGTDVDLVDAQAAVLMDVSNAETLYAYNAHEQLYPASLTKVMTALVAIKYGSLDQTLTATSAVTITESGAQVIGIKSGDSMTLDQALRILLLYSANDVALLIAENIGGSVDNFIEMMNAEAASIGATNTHFTNPHGLTDADHYTTAYDLYLIFNEAIQYETFNEIIQMTSYQTTYTDSAGNSVAVDINTTNQFLRGTYASPANITVIGGKTGTTAAAGHCLILLARDTSGNPYIATILKSGTTVDLYTAMTDLLDEINN